MTIVSLAEFLTRYSVYYRDENSRDGDEPKYSVHQLIEIILQYDFIVPLLQGKKSCHY